MLSRDVRRLLLGGLLTASLCAAPACHSPGETRHSMPCGVVAWLSRAAHRRLRSQPRRGWSLARDMLDDAGISLHPTSPGFRSKEAVYSTERGRRTASFLASARVRTGKLGCGHSVNAFLVMKIQNGFLKA